MHTLLLPLIAMTSTHTFEIKDHKFLLDGKPFQIVAGEVHYSRIPEPYWRHRIKMARAMGLNTLAVYVFWNFHEEEKDKYSFRGAADVARFVRMAKEEGLWVLLRPGPYCCAEWEFGGYPYWLLTEPGLVVRQNNKPFLDRAARYMKKLGEQLAPLQVTRGGNILMVQVENEYGSYGSDKVFMGATRDLIRAAGFDVPLFTADGPSQMPAGSVQDVLPGLNGVGGPEVRTVIDKFMPGGPYLVPEFYPGWLCHWGEKFPRSDAKGVAEAFAWYLNNDVSVSIYMWHGGTNFGFWNGANFGGVFQPHITSYDYDAPLDEAGRATPKYMAMRAQAEKRFGPLSPVPDANPIITIPPFALGEMAPLPMGRSVSAEQPQPMERLGQGYGFVLYQHGPTPGGKLTISEVRDYAVVIVDGKTVGSLDRRRKEKSLDIPAGRLDILVENGGRINYGGELVNNLKGIPGTVTLEGKTLAGWKMYPLPLSSLRSLKFGGAADSAPTFLRGSFTLDKPGDTWLDMRGWKKGVVWVNGHNLGRYWWIGPQQTLYCPGCWLKPGRNEIVVFELFPGIHRTVQGLDHPVLDDPRPEPPIGKPRAKLDHEPKPTTANLIASGDLPDGHATREVRFPVVRGRYVAFEATSSQRGQDFASMAELWLLGADGKALDRAKWKVIYTNSEELLAEDGNADNLIDDDPATIWHGVWGRPHDPPPHFVVIDLGETVEFSGVRVQPRQDGPSAITKGYRLYAASHPF